MPVINITTWPISNEKKQDLMDKITKTINEVIGAPLDKITVYVQEIEKSNWSDAGVVGTDSEFITKSRRQAYEDHGK